MDWQQLTVPLIYGSMAFGLALLIVFTFALLWHLEPKIGGWLVPAVIPMCVGGIVLSVLTSSRSLTYAYQDIAGIGQGAALSTSTPQRLLTLGVLACSAVVIATALFARRRAAPSVHQPLLLAYLAFFIAHGVLSAVFGIERGIEHNSVYVIGPMLAVYLARGTSMPRVLTLAKVSLAIMMLGSLAAIAVIPDAVLQRNYPTGLVPGLNIRLWGLASSPNSIGPLALLLMLLEWAQPSRSRLLATGVWLVAAVVVVLAQSKTVVAAGAVVALFLSLHRMGRAPGGGVRIGYVLVLLGLLLLGALALAAWLLPAIESRSGMNLLPEHVWTLSGRFQIWQAAVDTWLKNPLFGYGPQAWGPKHRFELGMPQAFSAHNQFLESLSSAGIVGALSLLVYLLMLGLGAWRAAAQTRGASVGLFILVLARCLTEAPLEIGGLFNGDFVMHLLLFMFALQPRTERQRQRRPVFANVALGAVERVR